ncbi:MAG: ATP-binding protein [Nocardioides sp.]
MSPQHPRLDRGQTLLLLALIVTMDVALLALRDDATHLMTVWSSVGLGVGLLALSSPRRWPALALVVVALTMLELISFGVPAATAIAVAAAHGAQALGGAALLTRRGRRRAALSSLADLAALGLAALACGAIALVIETTARSDSGNFSGAIAVEVGAQHALSVLLFCSVLISAPRAASLALGAQSAALLVVLAAVFVPVGIAPFVLAPLPILVVGAIAFEVRVAALQLLATATFATVATVNGRGPFAAAIVRDDLVDSLTLGYLVCVALATLPLAVIAAERRGLLESAASEERLSRRAFTESPLGMLLLHEVDEFLVVAEANASAEPILGAPAGQLSGRRLTDVVRSVEQGAVDLDALLAPGGETWHGRAVVLRRPSSRIDLKIAAVAGEPGRPRTFLAQLVDQTTEQDSRRRLDIAQELTNATLDTVACIVIVTDADGEIVRVNAATEAITGFRESDLVGARLWDAPLTVLTRHETEAMFAWPNRSSVPITRERLASSAAGKPIRLVWNSNVVPGSAGTPSYAVLTGIDVTAERSSTGLMAHLLEASVATALIGIDVSGMITVFSSGAAHLLDCAPQEMIGLPFVSILDPAEVLDRTGAAGDREAFLCLMGMIGDGDGDESPERDWVWRARSGRELIVSMTLSVTHGDVEESVAFLCVGRDVTEQRQGQETIVAALEKERTAVERLRGLDRAKDEFVSTVSHELRTPITSILGYTELLLDGDVVEPLPEQAAMLETIARNSHRLIAICNDLLVLSEFESRDVLGLGETHDLRESINVAEDFARTAGSQRSLTFSFSSPAVPVLVSGDRSQLDRVLINLVSNAIKFTDDGGDVEVSLSEDPSQGAVVTVRDTGHGIDPAEHDLVFQRFYRTGAAHTMAIPGTGLGLSIVAGIIDAHGGTIDLDSRPGAGTTFTLRLPAAS